MRVVTLVTGICLVFAITLAISAEAEVKKPVGATTKVPSGLKIGPSRISKEDCGKKNGTVKDVNKSLCASGQYCSSTKSDGTADAKCIDEKKQ
jgi:hypothetical protein